MNKNKQTFNRTISDFDLRLLRIFKAVVECGGFAAAEAALNISGSAVSIAMNDLETRLGLRLCERGRAGFYVTAEGEQVFAAACEVLDSIEAFGEKINDIHTHLAGELFIGMTDNLVTIPQTCITNAISNLKAREPSIAIHLKMMPPDDIEIDVLEGRLQLGVVPRMRPLNTLEYTPLYAEQSQLYCGAEHSAFSTSPPELSIERVRQFDAINPVYTEKTDVSEHYLALNTTATASDREGIAVFILSGKYVGYLPTHFAKQWVEQQRMRALLPQHFSFSTQYSVIAKKSAHRSRLLQAFLEELNSVLSTQSPADVKQGARSGE
ncbi:MAG: LysR family transcriptional regulator [Pseudomonadales bacterium]